MTFFICFLDIFYDIRDNTFSTSPAIFVQESPLTSTSCLLYTSLVTIGPGATNLVTGLATAYYDSVPLVCFTGQVSRHLIGNDAFQEVDIVGITRSITKYGVTVRNREDQMCIRDRF